MSKERNGHLCESKETEKEQFGHPSGDIKVVACHDKEIVQSHIIVLNVLAPEEDETDDVKDSFYKELESVLDKFPKYHMKIMLDP
jgi:hypothetical protein